MAFVWDLGFQFRGRRGVFRVLGRRGLEFGTGAWGSLVVWVRDPLQKCRIRVEYKKGRSIHAALGRRHGTLGVILPFKPRSPGGSKK